MRYFTITELTKSGTAQRLGIRNKPNAAEKKALTALVENILDPLREAWGAPIVVNSGFRCAELNTAVAGAKGSQHLFGEAADIEAASRDPKDNRRLFELIRDMCLPYDQLIDEYGYDWVHVSFGPRNRRQVLHTKRK